MGLDTSWVKDFLDEANKFTGVGDRKDDQMDALFNALDTFPRDEPDDASKASDFGVSSGVGIDRLKA
jgi:hypothetical protein